MCEPVGSGPYTSMARPFMRNFGTGQRRAVVGVALAFQCTTASPVHALNPRDFTNANQLVWEQEFKAQVEAFFGSATGSYLGRSGLVSEQWTAAFGGPPEALEHLSEGWQFAACRFHSCDEKAWVLLDGDGTIQVVALRHFFTREGKASAGAMLTIFFRDAGALEKCREHAVRWSEQHGPVIEIQLADLR